MILGKSIKKTWLVGKDIFRPVVGLGFLRDMSDPIRDGKSRDYYPDRYIGPEHSKQNHLLSPISSCPSSSSDSRVSFSCSADGGVHINSGIFELGFRFDDSRFVNMQ
jgi:vibriolysin